MTTIVDELSKKTWEKCKKHMKFGYSFTRDSQAQKSDLSKIKGIYILTPKGVKPAVGNTIYVGETFGASKNYGINARIYNHKKSLREPDWVSEHTGKKFIKFDIPLDIEMDMWYIDSNDIGINDKQSSTAIEQFIQKHLKPKAWEIN